MRTKYFLIIFLLLSLNSCKKEEMDGDLAFLEGKWKFYAFINYASHTTTYTNSMAFNEEDMLYLEFEDDGNIKLYNHKNKIIERGRVISYTSNPSSLYINGIDYEFKIGSNAVFNRKLDNILSITLISTNITPLEFIINDFRELYDPSALELVFQKI